MSKVEQLRALREARFSHSQGQKGASASSGSPVPAPAINPFSASKAEVKGPGVSPAPEAAPQGNSLRPPVEAGKGINAYSQEDLEKLMQWVHLNNITATDEELVALGMQELGFVRKGKVIQQRLIAALRKS